MYMVKFHYQNCPYDSPHKKTAWDELPSFGDILHKQSNVESFIFAVSIFGDLKKKYDVMI